ncbi:50S ribosomal protein L16 [Candidatus Pacearchaeota archaeon]|nr:50S ribosomal protein L16 [Candidatus Pacearchaeota archaeon]
MALRKAASYSKHTKVAYTRKSSVKGKSYVKAIPACKIVKFTMGDIKKFNSGNFNYLIELKANEMITMRDNAIEAARQMIHRHLEDNLKGNYAFFVSCYPHHVLRENKMLTGAGADRMQTGMSQSFGVVMGIAARVRTGEAIFTIALSTEKDVSFVRNTLKKARAKLPCKTSINVTKLAGKAKVEQVEEAIEAEEA